MCIFFRRTLRVLRREASFTARKMEPVIIVHGGAGAIPDSRIFSKMEGVKLAAAKGYRALRSGGSILDAVEAAVVSMEKDEAFNAGYGSVLNLDGEVEMEASMQRGSDLNAGCVTLVQNFAHPISIARKVLEDTPHSLLGGKGAYKFAIEKGFHEVDPSCMVSEQARKALVKFKQMKEEVTEIGEESPHPGGVGTVGAVAIDGSRRIAVATSTGGMSGKYVGRIGDTPQIGSGTYADDNVGGVSTTGHGESILKFCLAHAIIKSMEGGQTAQAATESAVKAMTARLNNTAGAITLSLSGDVGVYFTSTRMAWAYIKAGTIHYGVNEGEDVSEKFCENKAN